MDNNPHDRPADDSTHVPLPHVTDTLHQKPSQRKVPPHMRRLNMRFSSPSDNLSPMSQKLMLADRTNAAIKKVQPRSLKEVLLRHSQHTDSEHDTDHNDPAGGEIIHQQQTRNIQDTVMDDIDDDEEEDASDPPSPTRSHGRGGLVSL